MIERGDEWRGTTPCGSGTHLFFGCCGRRYHLNHHLGRYLLGCTHRVKIELALTTSSSSISKRGLRERQCELVAPGTEITLVFRFPYYSLFTRRLLYHSLLNRSQV